MRFRIPASLVCGALVLLTTMSPTGTAAATVAPADHGCTCDPVTPVPRPAGTDGPFGITEGPGGTWSAEGNQIVRIRPGGAVDQFPLPDPAAADAGWLTWAGGSRVWFADRGTGRLGTVDERGKVVEYQLPAGPAQSVGPGGIVVLGHTVWFTDPANDRIGRFDDRSHRFTMYTVPTAAAWPLGLTSGPDGALWFVERTAGKVARMSVHGAFREWALAPASFPNRIVVGPDHALWFTELDAGLIGRLTTGGRLTETPVDGGPVGITVGPDGHLYAALFNNNQLARLDSGGHITKTWNVPGALLVASSRGALWVTDPFADTLTRVRVGCPR